MSAPVAAASSRCPERKSAWKWVSITCSKRIDRLLEVRLDAIPPESPIKWRVV